MKNSAKLPLVALIAFAAALAGLFIGRHFILPAPPVESELHAFLHEELHLDAAQEAKVEVLEAQFAIQKRALELELRSDNARLAQAIQAEHGYGPQVAAAIDSSHTVMGRLQKATLEHIFAMRGVLRPDQTARFDAAVVKALTSEPK